MLSYKGLSDELNGKLGLRIKPIGGDMILFDTLVFHDDELPETALESVQSDLEEHFELYEEDLNFDLFYSKDYNYSVIEITIYDLEKKDNPEILNKCKTSFEDYYKKMFPKYQKLNK